MPFTTLTNPYSPILSQITNPVAKTSIKSLAKGNSYFKKAISGAWLLGYGKVKAKQTGEGLVVELPAPTNKIAPVIRITK